MPQIDNKRQNYISISSSFLDSDIMIQPHSTLKVFLYLLLKSNHKCVNEYGFVTSNRGEYTTTLEKIAGDLEITAPTVGKCLKWLKEKGYIEKKSCSYNGTHIRIKNYEHCRFKTTA